MVTALSGKAHVLPGIQTLNMPSLPFMSMEPYIKKEFINLEEKVLKRDKNSKITKSHMGP
jgi:hypothetical protein